MKASHPAPPRLARLPAAAKALVFVLMLAAAGPLAANPREGTVTAGGAQFFGGDGRLTIRQTTDKAIINWADFSIRRGEITEFIQPSRNSAVLNRVTGGNPSALNGALRANGKVFLINPNGIMVGPSGTIDVGGLVLSTLDVSDADFMRGRDMIFRGTSGAGVVNFGRINAIDGDVFLIGNSATNRGTITAPKGTVGLAAGSEVLITAAPNRDGERVFVRAAAGPRGASGVENSGTIEAAAAELKAHGNLYALAINNSGSIRATGANRAGGKVFLRAPGGRISNTGSIAASVPGSRGGRILIESADLDLGGSLETDPEGDITILSRVNLLPGATIGGQRLDDYLIKVNDSANLVRSGEMLREGGGFSAGGDLPLDRRTGTISRAGRLAEGPEAVVASTLEDGRVIVGMPGVTTGTVIGSPAMPAPAALPAVLRDESRPTRVQPGMTAPPGDTSPASPQRPALPQEPPIPPVPLPETAPAP